MLIVLPIGWLFETLPTSKPNTSRMVFTDSYGNARASIMVTQYVDEENIIVEEISPHLYTSKVFANGKPVPLSQSHTLKEGEHIEVSVDGPVQIRKYN